MFSLWMRYLNLVTAGYDDDLMDELDEVESNDIPERQEEEVVSEGEEEIPNGPGAVQPALGTTEPFRFYSIFAPRRSTTRVVLRHQPQQQTQPHNHQLQQQITLPFVPIMRMNLLL